MIKFTSLLSIRQASSKKEASLSDQRKYTYNNVDPFWFSNRTRAATGGHGKAIDFYNGLDINKSLNGRKNYAQVCKDQ